MRFAMAFLICAVGSAAQAVPIAEADFDGSETIMDFDGPDTVTGEGDYVEGIVTISTGAGGYFIQFAGEDLGGTLRAFSTRGNTDLENAVTISFADPISMFGVNFGTIAGNMFTSATVSAFGADDMLVESAMFRDFENTFVGFDFSTDVREVRIDRAGEDPALFTFLENLRFVESDAAPAPVPLPASALLLLGGLAALGVARRSAL